MKYCDTCHSAYPDDFTTCPRDQAVLRASSELVPGMRLRGKYEVLEKIGSGGMAAVYRARHLTFDEVRAIKLVSSKLLGNDEFARRFRTEAVITRRLQHPNAVRVDDFDTTEDGRPFIVMEYVEGDSLRQVLRRDGALSLSRAVAVARQVASALAAAHALGIVHRDIKPDNILLTRGPHGSDLVKVLDFGIAKVREGVLIDGEEGYTPTQTGMVVGTPQYISPEQAIGKRGDEVDGRSDLYSLGVVLYEMVTGRLPFSNTDTAMGMILHHLQTPPTPPDLARPDLGLPPEFSALLMKALRKDREERFASAGEMVGALDALTSLGPPTPRPAVTLVVDTEAETGLFPVGSKSPTPQPAPTVQAERLAVATPAPVTLVTPTVVTPTTGGSQAPTPARRRWLTWRRAALAMVALVTLVAFLEHRDRATPVPETASQAPAADPAPAEDSSPPDDAASEAQAATDEELLTLIEERLSNASATREESIDVEVEQGTVVLSGEVSTNAASQVAEALAESVPRVKRVRNRIRVARAQPEGPQAHPAFPALPVVPPAPPAPALRLPGTKPPAVGSKEERVVQELLKQGREALARGESVAAMKAFEAVQQKDPGNVEAIEGMTQAGIQMGMQFSRVFGQGNSELDADATRKVKDLLQKARDQMAKGDAEAAMKTYEAVLEIDATNSDAHRGIGKAAAQMSRDARNKARQTARPTTPPSP